MSTREERLSLKSSMPATRLSTYHTENCRVLPNRGELLSRIASAGVAAEIGAAFGDFSAEILSKNRPKELHLIDAWEGERYGAGLTKIRERFSEELTAGRLHIHRGLSVDRLRDFADDFFDWVYIDTNHSYGTTWKELCLCKSKVKAGGRIAGHDFCTGNVIDPVPYGVVEAVTQFCHVHHWQLEYLTVESHGHFSFCLMRL